MSGTHRWERLLGSDGPERELARDLAVAAEAALAGGEAALLRYGSDDLAVREKGEDDPVTAADDAANRAVLEVLGELAPGEAVLSEEADPPDGRRDAAAFSEQGQLWIVDPLDGTKEFLARNGEFAVMVGLAAGGRVRLGAVYEAAVDRLYLGIARHGAWVVADARHGGCATRLRVPDEPARPLRLAASRSHGDPALERLTAELGDVAVVRSGSVGIKCALVASGEADLYVHPVPYLKEWDTCAPEAVLRGAGGRVTDCAGGPLEYGKADPVQPRGIFAGQPAAWERARSAVRAAAGGLASADGSRRERCATAGPPA